MGKGRATGSKGSKSDLVSTSSSVHSLSSSDVSSETLSMIHRRSTPKLAAIIILTFFILAGLVGATVYFIHDDRLLNLLKAMSASESEKYEQQSNDMSESSFIPESIDFERDVTTTTTSTSCTHGGG